MIDTGKGDAREQLQKIVILQKETIPTVAVLSLLDILLSIFVITPLVVCTWRGQFGYLDLHPKYFPFIPTCIGAICMHTLLAVVQDDLHNILIETDKHWSLRIVSHLLRRFYTYVFFTVTVLHWRGVWGIVDYYMGIQTDEYFVAKKEGCLWFLIVWAACVLTLVTLKGLRNSIAPPFAICIDKGNHVFKFPTMFGDECKHSIYLSILDCLFSVCVMGNLVIVYWRGLWIVTDILLLPNNFIWSSWASMVLGLIVVGLVYRLQNYMKKACTISGGLTKVCLADMYILLSCVGTVLYWRGIWNTVSIYLLPDNLELSCILSNAVGFMALVVVGCSNSLLVRGVYQDGEESNGDCVVFPCYYLRIIMEQEGAVERDRLSSEEISYKKSLTGKIQMQCSSYRQWLEKPVSQYFWIDHPQFLKTLYLMFGSFFLNLPVMEIISNEINAKNGIELDADV